MSQHVCSLKLGNNTLDNTRIVKQINLVRNNNRSDNISESRAFIREAYREPRLDWYERLELLGETTKYGYLVLVSLIIDSLL